MMKVPFLDRRNRFKFAIPPQAFADKIAEEKTCWFLTAQDIRDRKRLSSTSDFTIRKANKPSQLGFIRRQDFRFTQSLFGDLNTSGNIQAAPRLDNRRLLAQTPELRPNPELELFPAGVILRAELGGFGTRPGATGSSLKQAELSKESRKGSEPNGDRLPGSSV